MTKYFLIIFALGNSELFVQKEWKTGRGFVGAMQPKFSPEPDVSDIREPVRPGLKLCTMSADGHLSIPRAERDKWLADPVRSCLAETASFRFSPVIYLLLKHIIQMICRSSQTRIGELDWPISTAFSVQLAHRMWLCPMHHQRTLAMKLLLQQLKYPSVLAKFPLT